ncbi:pectinesterase A [Aspergillus pseudodeflectus]|uniref:Pectinesterase n=1 Tax=Aspergillus pseudodeflectus TaxID=176178 RepID=A0ABR4JJX5_9EURO
MLLHRYLSTFLLAVPALAAPHPHSKRASRTSAPEGCLSVSKDGSGTYSTIAAALSALGSSSSDACIFIAAGTYQEQLTIDYGGSLTIYGETTDTGSYKQNTVTITHTISSPESGSLVSSATVNAQMDDFAMYNVDVVNGYGKGAQAVALAASGERQGYYGCRFLGYQDTLYARAGIQYYSNCYIEGAVDYIFGAASAWFGECTIVSNGAGYITAMSREVASDPSWYCFDHCDISGKSGLDLTGDVYLGRPWRVLARVIYQNSELSDIIHPAGWTTMAEGATPLYYEVNNTGEGADTSDRLYESEIAGAVDKTTVLGSGWAGWIDRSY